MFPVIHAAKASGSSSPTFTLGKVVGSVRLDTETAPTVSGEASAGGGGGGGSSGKNSLKIIFDGEMGSSSVVLTKASLEFLMEMDLKTGYWELKDLVLDYEVRESICYERKKMFCFTPLQFLKKEQSQLSLCVPGRLLIYVV